MKKFLSAGFVVAFALLPTIALAGAPTKKVISIDLAADKTAPITALSKSDIQALMNLRANMFLLSDGTTGGPAYLDSIHVLRSKEELDGLPVLFRFGGKRRVVTDIVGQATPEGDQLSTISFDSFALQRDLGKNVWAADGMGFDAHAFTVAKDGNAIPKKTILTGSVTQALFPGVTDSWSVFTTKWKPVYQNMKVQNVDFVITGGTTGSEEWRARYKYIHSGYAYKGLSNLAKSEDQFKKCIFDVNEPPFCLKKQGRDFVIASRYTLGPTIELYGAFPSLAGVKQ